MRRHDHGSSASEAKTGNATRADAETGASGRTDAETGGREGREETAVRLRGVGKSYGKGHTAVEALRGVDLTIGTGELVVLLGPSGSGKTTLLNLIGGIEPASAGTVEVAGRSLAGLDEDARTAYRRDAVGFVFQFFNLVPTLTAMENVRLVAELVDGERGGRRAGRGRHRERAREALEAVGLAGRADHFPAQLSGGEQQRVAIARAIAKDPELLLCDEPTGALDLETGLGVLRVLQDLNRRGRTVLVVTHNAAIAAIAHRVVRMRSGEVVDVATRAVPADAGEVAW